MSGRAAVLGAVVGLAIVGLAVPSAYAGSMTTVGAFLQQFALDAQSILYGACAILFTGALIMAGAASYGGVTHLLGVPIYYAMLGSFGAGVVSVFINGVGLTQGATIDDVASVMPMDVQGWLMIVALLVMPALVFVLVQRVGAIEGHRAD